MKIRDREIVRGGGYVVAEAGTNHWDRDEGYRFGRAHSLVLAAAMSGVDAVKFQIFVPGEQLFCGAVWDERRWGRWNHTILSPTQWGELGKLAHSLGLAFIGSAFQPSGVDIVQEVCDAHKVAVRANATYPCDRVVNKPIIVSSPAPWVQKIELDHCPLYCVPEYPCDPKKVDFGYMRSWDLVRGMAGYSDHCPGPWMSIKALALGAAIVEKHFVVFDRDKDPDGSHAATPEELTLICQARDAWK